MQRPLLLATTILALATALGPGAFAQSHRMQAEPVLSRGVPSSLRPTPLPRMQHAVFGTIVQLQPTMFTLRNRAGRLLRVDATIAIRNSMFSVPLYVGKTVVIEGSFDKRGTFDAVTVTRITRLEAATPGDR